MLKADPGNYELVRRVLGHRSITTTRNFYIGLETLEATRLFGEMVTDLERGEAPAKLSQERRAMPEKIRALPLCDWPTADREAWERACVAAQRLRPGGAAARMKPSTRTSLVRAYGYLLDFCRRNGLFDQDAEAGAHVTPEIIDAFVRELHDRVGSVTRASYVGKDPANRSESSRQDATLSGCGRLRPIFATRPGRGPNIIASFRLTGCWRLGLS